MGCGLKKYQKGSLSIKIMPTLPAATSTLSGISEWSNPMFQALLPYGYMAAGVLIGVGLIIFLIWLGGYLLHHLRGG